MATLFEELLEANKEDNLVQSIYRFQGGNSIEKINFDQGRFNYSDLDSYVYFSKTFKHHKYFASKRLNQFINEVILKDSDLTISKKSLTDIDSFKSLELLLENASWTAGLSSLEFCIHPFFLALLKENTVSSKKKTSQVKVPEKVDGRKYNGGFGLCGEWLELLEYFTFFLKTRELKNDHLLLFLRNLRKSTGNNRLYHKIDNTSFLEGMNYRICFNESLFNPFVKYKIMDCMERICDKGLYLEGSRFENSSKILLKEGLEEYEESRNKCLTKLSRLSSKRIM